MVVTKNAVTVAVAVTGSIHPLRVKASCPLTFCTSAQLFSGFSYQTVCCISVMSAFLTRRRNYKTARSVTVVPFVAIHSARTIC